MIIELLSACQAGYLLSRWQAKRQEAIRRELQQTAIQAGVGVFNRHIHALTQRSGKFDRWVAVRVAALLKRIANSSSFEHLLVLLVYRLRLRYVAQKKGGMQ